MFVIVPTPSIKITPSRVYYYTGQDLNVTCISSISGVVFTWSVVNITGDGETLALPAINNNDQTSVLAYKPIAYGHISVQITCLLNIFENANVIAAQVSTEISFSSKLSGFI